MFRRFDFKCVTPEKPWRAENLGLMIYWDQWLSITPAHKVEKAQIKVGDKAAA